jgi:hypothetical protein
MPLHWRCPWVTPDAGSRARNKSPSGPRSATCKNQPCRAIKGDGRNAGREPPMTIPEIRADLEGIRDRWRSRTAAERHRDLMFLDDLLGELDDLPPTRHHQRRRWTSSVAGSRF